MEITIHPLGVIIKLGDNIKLDISFAQLTEIERAFEIIRQLQKIVPIQSATIKVT